MKIAAPAPHYHYPAPSSTQFNTGKLLHRSLSDGTDSQLDPNDSIPDRKPPAACAERSPELQLLDASRDLADDSFTAEYNNGFIDKLMFSPGYKCSPDASIEQESPLPFPRSYSTSMGRPDNPYFAKTRFGSRSVHLDGDNSYFGSGVIQNTIDVNNFSSASSRLWMNHSQGSPDPKSGDSNSVFRPFQLIESSNGYDRPVAKSTSRSAVAPHPFTAIRGSSQIPMPKVGQAQYRPRNFDFNFENGSFASTISTMTAYPEGFLGAFPEYDVSGRVVTNYGDMPVTDITSSKVDSGTKDPFLDAAPNDMNPMAEDNSARGDAHFTRSSSSSNASGLDSSIPSSLASCTKSVATAFAQDSSSTSSGKISTTTSSNSTSKGRWQRHDFFLACFPRFSRLMTDSSVLQKKPVANLLAESSAKYPLRENVRMLWADKHRPASLDEFLCHAKQSQFLRQLISQGNCPHILFQGPRGSGKKTLITALLREIFGANAWKVTYEERCFKNKGETESVSTIPIVSSFYHMEVNANKLGEIARDVLISLLKEITAGIESSQTDIDACLDFKVLVIHEVDKLPTDAQQLIRWLMDRYGDACKLLLCAEEQGKVVDSIKSRSQIVNIECPGIQEIVAILQSVAEKEGFTLPDSFAARIAVESKQNLRHAIASLEACKSSQNGLKENQPIPTGWEDVVVEVANDILAEQTSKRLLIVRGKFQTLLGKSVPPRLILQRLAEELIPRVDDQLKKELCYWHGFYEKRMPAGTNSISKLEEFVAKFISIYKKFLKSAQ